MYELHIGLSDNPTVKNRISILNQLSIVTNVIQFRVFCYESRVAYVGSSGDKAQLMALIISKCAKSLNFIKMNYMESSS